MLEKKVVPLAFLYALLFILLISIPSYIAWKKVEAEKTKATQEEVEHRQPNEFALNFQQDEAVTVSLYRTSTKDVEKKGIETYVFGVVAAEMPASFELEALKAQAIAARTYVFRKHNIRNNEQVWDVQDSVSDQAYYDINQLKNIWGSDFYENAKKIKEAIEATEGMILTYKGKPIEAYFFSTSNGKTENSEDYWSNYVPYLRSVNSEWDIQSPKYERTVGMKVPEFNERLGIRLQVSKPIMRQVKRTSGGRIASVVIEGEKFTGREIREKLGLASSHFTMRYAPHVNEIVIKTYGYGHGVGMSQYGANGMAKSGMNFKEILDHYYTGVQIDSVTE
ncbi:MAG: stage II sporulation protein D [Bacilli bacterium]